MRETGKPAMNGNLCLLRFRRRQIATILPTIVLALLLPGSVAVAEQPGNPKSPPPAPSQRLLPLKGAATGGSCAAFGPDFVKVDGTDTCVKLGGAVRIDSVRSR
jgi:hypothetical protein